MTIRTILTILIFVFASASFAGEVGHYTALAWGPWDHMSPARGTGQAALGFIYYASDTMKDGSGDTYSGIDVDLSLPAMFAVLKYSPKFDILWANYSFGIAPAYGRTSINAYLGGTNIGGEADLTGWQDLNVIPVNLTWELSKYYSISAQYAFWAPTGSYHSSRELNLGLGYWSHDFRVTGSFFPMGTPYTLLSVSALYEISTEKSGTDIHPGDRFVIELGASHLFNQYLIAGLLASGNWEVTDTTGDDATDDGRDCVYSAGPEVIIYAIPEELSFSLRYFVEFAAKDRPEGQFFYAGLGYEF